MTYFRCEVCRSRSERLSMRDADGKFVCPSCLPAGEKKKLEKARGKKWRHLTEKL